MGDALNIGHFCQKRNDFPFACVKEAEFNNFLLIYDIKYVFA